MLEHVVVIRRATRDDLPALGRLGALLVRTHYEFDPARFMNPGANADEGYASFLETQLAEDDMAIFVAVRAGGVLGYIYVGIEPQSWKELREQAGFIHDIVVDEKGRRGGVAQALISHASAWLQGRGIPRVILWTADQNSDAQRLFSRAGFRRTMVEMTLEL